MKNLIIASTVAAALAVSASAMAMKPGFFVGGQLGTTTDTAQSAFNHQGFAGGVNGGYNFALQPNILVGGELGYQYLGQDKLASQSIDDQTINALATVHYLMNKFDVFAKGGIAFVNATATGPETGTNNDQNPIVALGAGYDVTQHVNVYAQYEHIFGDNSGYNADTPSFNGYFAGVQYMF